jgi:hypothetical protein
MAVWSPIVLLRSTDSRLDGAMRGNVTPRRGAILFEVVVGLTILAIAGIGWITLLAQTRASIAHVRAQEARISEASDLLQRYRFLSESEYDARLGTRRVGALAVGVSSVAPHLYSLVALDSTDTVLLTTTVYARDTTSNVR